MQALIDYLTQIKILIWGNEDNPAFVALLLLGVGIYLSLGLRFMPWRNIAHGFKLLF